MGKIIPLSLMGLLSACELPNRPQLPAGLNSRFNDEQPSLSGDGRLVAFVSNRNGKSQILLYDLQGRRFIGLRGLDPGGAIAESPSLSRTGRYLVYISSIQGRPDIVLYDQATGRSQLLTQGYRSWIRNPNISPDGRYIVFETARRGQWDIEVLDRGPLIELDIADGSRVPSPQQ
ncbi:WD40 domain protein beta Propeller [Gloeothece citriformis PCC 7424]|uniref:WD40 domain protein beta Propeller n=2 Tax=Gloeothece TaxID=28070 RepID=B7KL17_GLOC7|nr:WD40 domain protein beta Propeller [Gloeothece citriformis PCC 7424]